MQILAYWNALTPREKEIVSLLLRGEKEREIAAILGISQRTVKVLKNSIYKKLSPVIPPVLQGGRKQKLLLHYFKSFGE
jgi:FixJ family two-component response regulator